METKVNPWTVVQMPVLAKTDKFSQTFSCYANTPGYGSFLLGSAGLGHTGCCGAQHIGSSLVTQQSLEQLIKHTLQYVILLEYSEPYMANTIYQMKLIVQGLNTKHKGVFTIHHHHTDKSNEHLLLIEIHDLDAMQKWRDS